MARTLDQIMLDTLGLKEMTIARLQWKIEDSDRVIAELQAQLAAAQQSLADASIAKQTVTEFPRPTVAATG